MAKVPHSLILSVEMHFGLINIKPQYGRQIQLDFSVFYPMLVLLWPHAQLKCSQMKSYSMYKSAAVVMLTSEIIYWNTWKSNVAYSLRPSLLHSATNSPIKKKYWEKGTVSAYAFYLLPSN